MPAKQSSKWRWSAAVVALLTLSVGVGASTIEVVYTELTASPTSIVPGAKDASGNPVVAHWTALQELAMRPDGGEWVVKGSSDLGSTLDSILVLGAGSVGNAFCQDGQPVQGGAPGEQYDFFDSPVPAAWNDASNIAYSFRAKGGVASVFEKVVVYNSATHVHTIVVQMGDLYTGLVDQPPNPSGDERAGNSIASVHLLNDGRVGFVNTPIQNCHSSRYPAFLYDHAGFRQCGVSIVGGDVIADMDYDDSGGSPDGHWFIKGDLTKLDPNTGGILVVDDSVVLRQGSPVAGSSMIMRNIIFTRMLPGGTWFCRGDSPDTGNPDWAVRDGVLLAKTGDPINASLNWGNAFSAFNGNDAGDWVLAGNTDSADPNKDTVLVLNGSDILATEGDPVDVNGNGLFDDDAFIASFQPNDLFLNETGIWFLVTLRNAAGTAIGDAFLHMQPPTGACCVGEVCQILSAADCAALSGEYLGNGSLCFPNPCVSLDYWLQVQDGLVVEQGGTGFQHVWFLYPNNWWNQWWANEFAPDRQKEVTISFRIDFPVGMPAPVVAFNYSELSWPDQLAPPLPAEDPFVVRVLVDPPVGLPGMYTYTTRLPFCPRWVSMDVQGYDFSIEGTIQHVCLPSAVGACCFGPVCAIRTAVDCATQGGVYQGDGTDCFPNPCVPRDYWIRVQGGTVVEQGGTGFEGQWYLYPNNWWNQWWPNEFALDRQKDVTITFDIDFPGVGAPPVVAFNFSEMGWPDPSAPPLPQDDPFVIRVPVDPPITGPGTYTFTTRLPFCPRWVSMDVQGYDFSVEGTIEHICLPSAVGACCFGPVCAIRTAGQCAAQGGVYQGDGTDCFPNPCVPRDYWLRVQGGMAVEQGGTGFEHMWFLYPNNWWNQWWPNEFALDRQKEVTIVFDIDFPTALPPVVAFNFSEMGWPDPSAPPLPADDPFVIRLPVDPPVMAPGTYTFVTRLPFCPRWVSMDVQGYDFSIEGTIQHVCLPPYPVCRGDCNCDGTVGFADIDLFVAGIPNNQANWAAKYLLYYGTPPPPGCWENCDVNNVGTHCGFDDIDPFVKLIPTPCTPRACCFPDHTCQDLLPGDCLIAGGVFFPGPAGNLPCSLTTCP